MFCSSCGKQVSENAIFCPNCGIKIGGKRKTEQPEKPAPSGHGVSIPAALREEDGSGSTVYLSSDDTKKMFSRPAVSGGSGSTEYLPSSEDPDSSQTVYMPDDDVFYARRGKRLRTRNTRGRRNIYRPYGDAR